MPPNTSSKSFQSCIGANADVEVKISTPELNASSSGSVHQAFMMLWDDGIVANPCLGPISDNQIQRG